MITQFEISRKDISDGNTGCRKQGKRMITKRMKGSKDKEKNENDESQERQRNTIIIVKDVKK